MAGVDNSLSFLPIVALLFILCIVSVILMVYISLRTKRATHESDIGQFQFVLLPDGESITGICTLARTLVSDQYLQTLVDSGHVSDASAKKLSATFSKLNFYAIKNGRAKILFVSKFNIEDPKYHVDIKQIFAFPFGFRSHRLVIADSKASQKAGWDIRVITPYERGKEFDPKTWKEVVDIGDCAAAVKEAAIRIQSEQPWKEVAAAIRHELDEAQNKLAEVTSERDSALLALSTKPLLQSETPPQTTVTGGGIPFWRLVVTVAAAAIGQWVIFPSIWPHTDPTVYSILLGGATFILYPIVTRKLSELF